MNKLIQLKNKKGFTLIEMLVVILIIVILIAIAIPAVAGYRADANETADKGAAETIFNALEAAATKYPPSESANRGTATVFGIAQASDQVFSNATITIGDDTQMTGPYLVAVQEFLGTNVQGTFKFNVTLSTGSVNWVTYVRDGVDQTKSANTMLYHALDGVSGYLDEVINPATGKIYANNSMMHKIATP